MEKNTRESENILAASGKCSIQQAQIYTRRPEDYSQNQDQNTRVLTHFVMVGARRERTKYTF